MPELPEVETIRRDLDPLVRGRAIASAWVSPDAPRLVQLMDPREFERLLPGHRIEAVARRGKYLIFHLDRGMLWAVHLRMTGRLRHAPPDAPEDAYLRARFTLDDGARLDFNDLRKFGTMWLVDDWSIVDPGLGPEPLDGAFEPGAFYRVLKRRSAPVKAVLLDQSAIAGIGNIYADEALFAAGIDPRKPADRVSRPAAGRLHAAIVRVLEEALADRGSSFSDYVDGRGNEGMHHLKVKVFRRTGEPCYACGTPIRRVKLAGRSTHFCPKCQR